MSVKLTDLVTYINEMLQPEMFKDYCPNGLQVEGGADVSTIVSGVTASQALIDKAVEMKADVLLVHHGFFWRGEDSCITKIKKRRIKALLENDISLLAYHLPLDAHPSVGNNAQLADKLGITITSGLELDNPRSVGNFGCFSESITADELAQRIDSALGRKPLLIDGGDHVIKKIAWCTGGAQGYIDKAIALGADAYISGEISESTVHTAREAGIHYLAAGHHATERYGVQALGRCLEQAFDVEHHFVEISNPA